MSDIALIKNNAKVGADIAVEFSKLNNSARIGVGKTGGTFSSSSVRGFHSSCVRSVASSDDAPLFKPGACDGDVLIIGGANVDRTYRVKEERVQVSPMLPA